MSNRNRWYFYSGRIPVPVALPDGRVYAVRPRGYVYTDISGVRKYGSKFRPCAPPSDADSILKMLSIKVDAPPSIESLKETAAGPLATTVIELGRAAKGSPAPEPPMAAAKKDSPSSVKRVSRNRRSTVSGADKVGTDK